MEQEILLSITGTAGAALGSIVTWILNRRQQNAATDHTIIEGMQKSLQFYEQLSDDTKKRLDEAVEDRNLLKEKIEQQDKKIAELERQLLRLSVSLCYNLSCEMRKKDNKINVTDATD